MLNDTRSWAKELSASADVDTLGFASAGAAPMKPKISRVKGLVPDYAIICAIIAIVLSVAVLLGITYRYATRSEPRDDLAARMSAPSGQRLLPSEL
jgi:hypothetical protein